MPDVFVSRPLDLEPEFQAGLDGFLRLLVDQGLTPRTVGDSDFPLVAPLDAVIELLDECAGAVILGYPQLSAVGGENKKSGFVVDESISSAWNHIEAALAYSKNLSMLIVTHHGVDRGIFDRGAANKFVYQEDLSESGWPLSRQIMGAVNSWKKAMKSVTPLQETAEPLSTHPSERVTPIVDKGQLEVLVYVAENSDVTRNDVAVEFDISDQRAMFFVDELLSSKAVEVHYGILDGMDDIFVLTSIGRKILFDLDLLK